MDNTFNSIDRLIEFGMSMSIANQMIETMNQAMAKMDYVGNKTHFNAIPSTIKYYVIVEERQVGPLSEFELEQLVQKHLLKDDTLIWHFGMDGWKFAKDVPYVAKILLLNKQ